MKLIDREWFKGLPKLLTTRRPEPIEQAERIVGIQLHIVLPAKAGVIAVCLYYLFYSRWFYFSTERLVAFEMLQAYFWIYVFCNALATVGFALWRRFPAGLIPWAVFTLGLLDGLFIAGLALITGGFGSNAFWLFPALIVLNAVSIPLAMPQVVLNVLLSFFFLGAGLLDASIQDELVLLESPGRSAPRPASSESTNESPLTVPEQASTNGTAGAPDREARTRTTGWDTSYTHFESEEQPAEPVLRMFVLWLVAACCYGVQVLAQRQRQVVEEAREFAVREGQLRSAARLAAEFAHQIKNPLAIINNASFSLQRALKDGRRDLSPQIEIIQEEVERSDRIVTQIMGYAQLGEGRVEKLDVIEELNRAIEQIFAPALLPEVEIERRFESYFPPLLMYRRHLSEVFLNLLQNARDAVDSRGRITVAAACRSDYTIEVSIADRGPGIAPDRMERVFEAYYTTKEKGTGLGLAIVKHNVELYGGTVRVESELGKGARFIILLPAKTVINRAGLR